MSKHTIIAAGQFSVTLIHPLWNSETPTTIGGFKLEGQMVQDQQLMDNSKVMALANGNTIPIANNKKCGSIALNVTATNNDDDMVQLAKCLKRAGHAVGVTIRGTRYVNGETNECLR